MSLRTIKSVSQLHSFSCQAKSNSKDSELINQVMQHCSQLLANLHPLLQSYLSISATSRRQYLNLKDCNKREQVGLQSPNGKIPSTLNNKDMSTFQPFVTFTYLSFISFGCLALEDALDTHNGLPQLLRNLQIWTKIQFQYQFTMSNNVKIINDKKPYFGFFIQVERYCMKS